MENQTDYLVDESRLCGRKVFVTHKELGNIHGVLHSLSSNGVLVREESGIYHFFPWLNVTEIYYAKDSHRLQEDRELKDKISEDELKLLLIRKTIEDELGSDYRADVTDEGFDIVYDDDTVLQIIDNILHVSDDSYITEAKDLISKLKEYGIKEIERDYEE